ncbi:MAG: hypothetical protein IVW51_17300 [Thermaceae bacterium]|nr:hypothetical protein [Thermaceae bacterium]
MKLAPTPLRLTALSALQTLAAQSKPALPAVLSKRFGKPGWGLGKRRPH